MSQARLTLGRVRLTLKETRCYAVLHSCLTSNSPRENDNSLRNLAQNVHM
jgi:hypothetical protein